MGKNLTLVLGGAASGKSALAEKWVKTQSSKPHYIATAQAFDDEMRDKILSHQRARGPRWITHEAPMDLPSALADIRDDAVLVDCVTLWLSNLLLAEQEIEPEVDKLIQVLEASPCNVTLVSNEVGYGIVPDTSLGRKFRNIQGRANQRLAEVCDNVSLVAAGLPLVLKGQTLCD